MSKAKDYAIVFLLSAIACYAGMNYFGEDRKSPDSPQPSSRCVMFEAIQRDKTKAAFFVSLWKSAAKDIAEDGKRDQPLITHAIHCQRIMRGLNANESTFARVKADLPGFRQSMEAELARLKASEIGAGEGEISPQSRAAFVSLCNEMAISFGGAR